MNYIITPHPNPLPKGRGRKNEPVNKASLVKKDKPSVPKA
jgi:hypothetical protein